MLSINEKFTYTGRVRIMAINMAESIEEGEEEEVINSSRDKSYHHSHPLLRMLATCPMILYKVTLTPSSRS